MNFELDSYMDAIKDFPSKEIQLETLDNTYYHFKTDVFKGMISYSTSANFGANVVTISSKRAKEIIAMNKRGTKPDTLNEQIENDTKQAPVDYENVVGQDSLTRFDTQKKRPNHKNKRPNNRPQVVKNGSAENKENTPRFQKPIKKNGNNTGNNEK